jgi:hypothetical protein
MAKQYTIETLKDGSFEVSLWTKQTMGNKWEKVHIFGVYADREDAELELFSLSNEE